MAGPTQSAVRACCLLALVLAAAFTSSDAFAFPAVRQRVAAPAPLVFRTPGSSPASLARSTLGSHPVQRRLLVQRRSGGHGGASALDLLRGT